MLLLSMNEITTLRWSLEEDIVRYQQAGFRSIGIWRQKLTVGDEEQAIDYIAGSGMQVSSLLWAGGFTGSDGRTLEECILDAAEALRHAAALQAGCLELIAGGRNNHTFRHADRLLRLALDELLPLAEDLGVPLALTPMHPACAADWTFQTDLASTVAFIREYQTRLLKLAYDTYHFPLGMRQRHLLTGLAPHTAIVHLSDRRLPPSVDQECCLLGCGAVPLAEIVSTLHAAGYSGPFDVKLVVPDVHANNYWSILEHTQMYCADLMPAPAPSSMAG